MSVTFTIYMMAHCTAAAEIERIAAAIGTRFREVAVTLVHLDREIIAPPLAVFSVPTYLLDGDVVSLGNPDLDDLDRRIRHAVRHAGTMAS